MPKSKTRKTAAPARTPARRAQASHTLNTALTATVMAGLELVREAELHIQAAARAGDAEGVTKALSVHHYLRTGVLGLMIAHSELEGLPDPRAAAPTA